MEPDQNNQNTESVSNNDVVFRDKPKRNKGVIAGMVCLALLAIGGISFGVWAMMDGNTKVAKKDEQIASLNKQLVENRQTETVVDIEMGDGESDYNNPVIKSNDPEVVYRVGFQSSYYYENGQNYVMRINLKDGGVDSCLIYKGNGAFDSDCTISGVDGEIFRIVEFGEGQDNTDSNIGFLMADGTVKYFPFIEAMKSKDFSIKGQLNINGFVTDIFGITVGASNPNVAGGYGSTVFILNDGSFLKYNNSMLQ